MHCATSLPFIVIIIAKRIKKEYALDKNVSKHST